MLNISKYPFKKTNNYLNVLEKRIYSSYSNVIEFQSRVLKSRYYNIFVPMWGCIHPYARSHYNIHSPVMILHLERSKRQTNHALLTIVYW